MFAIANWRQVVLLATLTTGLCTTATAGPAACPPPWAGLQSYRAVFHSTPVPAAAMTRFLPDDGSAVLLFKQPPASGFYVFESRSPDPARAGNQPPLTLVSLDPAPKPTRTDPPPVFTDLNSSALQIAMDDRPIWVKRSFFIVACDAATGATSWGRVRARAGDDATAMWICIAFGIATYFFSMLCLAARRRPAGIYFWNWLANGTEAAPAELPHGAPATLGLADKYPAIFKRQPLGRLSLFNPIHLTVNEFGVPSVQKFQVVLFSSLVSGLLLYLVLRGGTLVDLSGTVMALMGISLGAAASSKAVQQQNTRLSFDNWAWLQRRGVLKNDFVRKAYWSDLLTSNQEFDISKMQALAFSVVVAVALLFAGAGGDLSTFEVPETLLGVLGLSQVAFIGGLLVQPPSVKNLDDALTRLRRAGETVAAAKKQNTDTGADGKLLDKLPSGSREPGENAQRQYDDMAKNVYPMIESTLEVETNDNTL